MEKGVPLMKMLVCCVWSLHICDRASYSGDAVGGERLGLEGCREFGIAIERWRDLIHADFGGRSQGLVGEGLLCHLNARCCSSEGEAMR